MITACAVQDTRTLPTALSQRRDRILPVSPLELTGLECAHQCAPSRDYDKSLYSCRRVRPFGTLIACRHYGRSFPLAPTPSTVFKPPAALFALLARKGNSASQQAMKASVAVSQCRRVLPDSPGGVAHVSIHGDPPIISPASRLILTGQEAIIPTAPVFPWWMSPPLHPQYGCGLTRRQGRRPFAGLVGLWSRRRHRLATITLRTAYTGPRHQLTSVEGLVYRGGRVSYARKLPGQLRTRPSFLGACSSSRTTSSQSQHKSTAYGQTRRVLARR